MRKAQKCGESLRRSSNPATNEFAILNTQHPDKYDIIKKHNIRRTREDNTMKVKVPTLETDRLILRMWRKKDAKDLYAYAKNPNVGPPAGWKPHSSPAESKMVITQTYMNNTCWAIVDKNTDKPIGSIVLGKDKFRPDVKSRELGYSMSEDYWGKGIMTEAAKRVIQYAFDNLKLDVLMVTTGESNTRSQRVIEKCGFTYEGTLRKIYRAYDGSIREVRCYSILREEYEKFREEGVL